MKTLHLFVLTAVLAVPVIAQDAKPKRPIGPVGDIVAVDLAHGLLTIKTLQGAEAKATVTSRTEYLVVEPGKKDLEGATQATLADVKVGDRVLALGDAAADGTVAARRVVLMSADAIAERNKRDAQDWMRRGLRGEVHAVDAATGNVTVESYRGDTVVVAVGTGTTLRRLKGGPTDLANSEPIALADVKVGDQVATRGDRSQDGSHVTAESLFVGAFPRPVGGRVASIDAAKHELAITTRAGAAVTITLESDALVRKLTPPQRRPGEGGAPGGGPAAGGPGGGAAPGGPGGGPGGFGGQGRGGGFGFGMDDRAELEKRTTPLALADVKPGDIVFAVVEPGGTASAVKAKVLVKLDLPADRAPRGPSMGPAMPSGDPGAGSDAPPN